MEDKYRIGLFGGSFDPPTKGHLHVAESLLEKGILDEVQFVPAYVSYHGKSYEASGMERRTMLQCMIDDSPYHKAMRVNEFELVNKMNSSTCDFVEKFLGATNVPENVQYYFIVGGDNAKKVPKFINAKKLMELIPFVVVNRGNDGVSSTGCDWYNEEPHICVDIDNRYGDVSSTMIRNTLGNMYREGLPATFLQEWCSYTTFAMILECELYGVADENY